MTYMDLQALRHYVRQAQKIIYETRSCIIDSGECDTQDRCTPSCKIYAFCTDIHSTRVYLNKKIREREALELHRDTQESK